MSLWCLMAAPLLATCDLRKIDALSRQILTAPEVIAINQDPLGKQARRTVKDRDLEIWKKPLSGGQFALGLLNRARDTQELKVKWSDIGIPRSWRVRDLWSRTDLGVFEKTFATKLTSHETRVLRLSPA
jgi:alpha-galactosidase